MQSNVTTTVNDIDDNYVSLVAPSSCSISSFNTMEATEIDDDDGRFTYPHGMLDFVLECGSVGGTVTVEQYYFGVEEDDLQPRKFNPTTEEYSQIEVLVSQVTVGGENAYKVIYQITDGGDLDTDGTANGIIRDPVGLALADSLSSTGSSALSSMLYGILISTAAGMLWLQGRLAEKVQ